jgi:hypothetical protein
MAEKQGLLSSGLGMVMHNKRYIFWFFVLNLILAALGVAGFSNQAHAILDHSLHAQRLVHGFDIGVAVEMFARPEFGTNEGAFAPGTHFALLFFVLSALFMPGVLLGFASNYRLPRDQFFRACGRNLWRFIRLLILSGIVMGIAAAVLFGLHGLLEKKAAESTNELLLPEVRAIGLLVIFLVMAWLRICFDLAEADVVLHDQNAVRKSIGAGFRHAWKNLGRLLGSYVFTTIIAAIIALCGVVLSLHFVPSDHVVRAVIVGQITLFLLLIPRFWQRGVAVSYWQQMMLAPVAVPVVTPAPVTPEPLPVSTGPAPAPAIPSAPPATT